jgi:hypothetical protein
MKSAQLPDGRQVSVTVGYREVCRERMPVASEELSKLKPGENFFLSMRLPPPDYGGIVHIWNPQEAKAAVQFPLLLCELATNSIINTIDSVVAFPNSRYIAGIVRYIYALEKDPGCQYRSDVFLLDLTNRQLQMLSTQIDDKKYLLSRAYPGNEIRSLTIRPDNHLEAASNCGPLVYQMNFSATEWARLIPNYKPGLFGKSDTQNSRLVASDRNAITNMITILNKEITDLEKPVATKANQGSGLPGATLLMSVVRRSYGFMSYVSGNKATQTKVETTTTPKESNESEIRLKRNKVSALEMFLMLVDTQPEWTLEKCRQEVSLQFSDTEQGFSSRVRDLLDRVAQSPDQTVRMNP